MALLSPTQSSEERLTWAPSLIKIIFNCSICVHVKTIRLNGLSVILPSADCRLLKKTGKIDTWAHRFPTLGECLDIFALINKGFLCTNVHGLLDHFGNLCTKAIFGIFVTEVSIGKEESIRAKTEPIFLPVRLEERRHWSEARAVQISGCWVSGPVYHRYFNLIRLNCDRMMAHLPPKCPLLTVTIRHNHKTL